ncbi:hypothetical protein OGAPHI_004853 [Ogataea philodendri]|uniref:Uncharacterized protein n=1 Tax=Ogataea philodendri TaxID=1378263 RepID=A0A9P8P3S6_9ASCO|nr:uncharacterized protein OGAPHI_004853 [Ogataea philodendri]KAH3664139.1 hypothetical protein OGAPHI_004853 [Ogataea philodendri]
MSKFVPILLYSLVMGISSFLSGLIPLAVEISPANLHYASMFSVGLLISTAFVLIIKEGLEHYTVDEPIGLWMLTGFAVLFTINSLTSIVSSSSAKPSSSFEQSFQLDEFDRESSRPFTPPPSSHRHEELGTPFAAKQPPKNLILAPFKNAQTLGLIIHALTDGIALAASVLSAPDSSTDLGSMFVVFAIFIHKLPTCFALASLLLAEGLSRIEILHHVGIFSLSSPAGAFLTYLFVTMAINVDLNEAAGELLVFSGGAFLFVAFHALHETLHQNQRPNDKRSQFKALGICLLGMILPAFITLIEEE